MGGRGGLLLCACAALQITVFANPHLDFAGAFRSFFRECHHARSLRRLPQLPLPLQTLPKTLQKHCSCPLLKSLSNLRVLLRFHLQMLLTTTPLIKEIKRKFWMSRLLTLRSQVNPQRAASIHLT
jgi:hypothetical protein